MKNLCIFILLFSFCFNEIYAQQRQKTAYEKKKDELLIQLGSKYDQKKAQSIVDIAENKGDREFIAYAASLKNSKAKDLTALYGQNAPTIDAIKWYASQLKLAEKLKTAADLKRDKDVTDKKNNTASRVFKITPKRVKRSNGTVLTPEMSITVTTAKHTNDPFYNGAKEIKETYMRIYQFDYQKACCSKNDFEFKKL
jgi:hypothetical protein